MQMDGLSRSIQPEVEFSAIPADALEIAAAAGVERFEADGMGEIYAFPFLAARRRDRAVPGGQVRLLSLDCSRRKNQS